MTAHTADPPTDKGRPTLAAAFDVAPAVWALAAVKLLVHLLCHRGYGIFRDELYYLACADHLAWGYVDQPPLSIAVLALDRALFGDSLLALRWVPALAGALTVLVVGALARTLGGGARAQALAAAAALVPPIYLALAHFYSMNAFDILFWAAAALVLTVLLAGGDRRLWWLLGAVLGLGLLNKISVLWFGGGLGVGLLVTGARRWLRQREPWISAGLAGSIFLPHVLWQIANGWPTIEFIRNATGLKMRPVAPFDFLADQVMAMHPLTLPLWLGGLAWLLFFPAARPWRPLAWIYLAVLSLLVASGSSRTGYLAPAYTWLLAAGAVAADGWLGRRIPRRATAVVAGGVALLLAAGAATAPLALPVLPVDVYPRYAEALGVEPSTAERKELRELPQFYADMFGWPELAAEVGRVFAALRPHERTEAAIFTGNYGEAGAIDRYGPELGLPPAISGHNNYWLWGPRGATGSVVVLVGGDLDDHRESFATVELVGRTDCRHCMPYEDGLPIYVGRGLRLPLAEAWPRVKHYD